MLNLRDLLISCATVLLLPTATLAQQDRVHSIGFLGANTPQTAGHLTSVFISRLKHLGWVEGKNLKVEYRWAAGQTSQFRVLADELVAHGVELIVTSGDAAGRAARAATETVPIVMASCVDPVGTGLAASIARPGGNVTGLTSTHDELAGKRLQLLREVVPDLSRVAVLRNPDANQNDTQAVRAAASTFDLRVDGDEIRHVDYFDYDWKRSPPAAIFDNRSTEPAATRLGSSIPTKLTADRRSSRAARR